MNKIKRLFMIVAATGIASSAFAQFDESGIAAGFFDSSKDKEINFSQFHLPPLAVLLENAKTNPQIISLEKARQIAVAEVAKTKRSIFGHISGSAGYSYGKADMWGNNSSTTSYMIYQFQGSEQSYWNVGVRASITVEDILDYVPSIRRSRLEVDKAVINKDIAFDELKLRIANLYVKITNDLISLKSYGEAAAAYQGAGALTREEFENGNLEIETFARTKMYESSQVSGYQSMQTAITTDIITLEILTHTPIITNSTTEITLDTHVTKSDKEIAKENKSVEKRIKKAVEEEEKRTKALEKAEKKAEKAAAKASKKENKTK